jgi:hypothetical protein
MMTLFIRITAGHGSVASNSVGRPCHVGRESRRRSLKPQSSFQFGIGRPICSRTAGLRRRNARMSCKQARQRDRLAFG